MMPIDGVNPSKVNKIRNPYVNGPVVVCTKCVFVNQILSFEMRINHSGILVCNRCANFIVAISETAPSRLTKWNPMSVMSNSYIAFGYAEKADFSFFDSIMIFFGLKKEPQEYKWKIRDEDYYRLHDIVR